MMAHAPGASPSIHDELADLTALLELKRAPWLRIERAEEFCDIAVDELKRRVSLTIAPPRNPTAAPGAPRLTLIDLLQPRKGELVDVELIDPEVRVRRVSHERHIEISRNLIIARLASTIGSTVFVGKPPAAFAAAIANSIASLTQLPGLPVSEAVKVVGDQFTESGRLKAIPADGSTRIDPEQMDGLFELCKLLATRYLVLVEAHVDHDEAWDLHYEYRQLVRVSPDHNDFHADDELLPFGVTRTKASRPKGWIRARLRRIFGAPPTWIRVHTPLARWTNHYALRVTSPPNHFFSRVVVLEDLSDSENLKPPRSATALNSLSPGVSVAVNFGRGVNTQCFVSDGRLAKKRIYVGLVTKELPNHSAFRAALVLAITTFVLTAFSVLAAAGATAITEVASLVVALLSIGYLIVEALMPRQGLQGAPVLSGILISLGSLISVLFCLWLVSLSAVGPAPAWLKPQPWDWLAVVWRGWIEWGSLTLIAISSVLLFVAIYRCWVISTAFIEVSETRPRYSNMYVGK